MGDNHKIFPVDCGKEKHSENCYSGYPDNLKAIHGLSCGNKISSVIYFIVFFILVCISVSLITTLPLFSQSQRNVLFESATNCCCGPCYYANKNVDSFLVINAGSTSSLKYHTSFPGPDPMYSADSMQNYERYRQYYDIYSIPVLRIDGIIVVGNFSFFFLNYFLNQRLAEPAPLGINVINERIQADSVKSTVTLNLSAGLPQGNYKLRVFSVERKITYEIPPGTNGESEFFDVFRKAHPDTRGVDAPVTSGAYTYIYKYRIFQGWADTSIYTIAFVQNDNTKEVLNSGKSACLTYSGEVKTEIPGGFGLSQNHPNPFNSGTRFTFTVPERCNVIIDIYSLLGRKIKTLVSGIYTAGIYEYYLNAEKMESGVYYCRMTAGDNILVNKMVLLK